MKRSGMDVPLDSMVRWVVLFRSRNRLDGYRQYIVREDGNFAMFRTRKAARAYAFEALGYIGRRDDLRREPHGWMTPKVVRVTITANNTVRGAAEPRTLNGLVGGRMEDR